MARVVTAENKDHPTIYQIHEGGEHLMFGSEVGYYMGYFKGNLYKRFPSMWRKVLSTDERTLLGELCVGTRKLSNMGTMVVRAEEAIQVLKGEGNHFRQKNTAQANQNNQNKEAINAAFCRRHSSKVDKSVIKNMTYETEARLRNNEILEKMRYERGYEVREMTAIPSMNIIPSIELDSPAVAVMNSVSVDSEYLRAASSQQKRKRNDKSKEIIVQQLHPSCKLYDDDTEIVHQAAKEKEDLVPIRLDIDCDGHKLRDTFTWNKNEQLITIETFAESLCNDLDLSIPTVAPVIINSMKNQIEQHSLLESEESSSSAKDQRVLIRLNLHVGNVSLIDQFEWDMSETKNDPEQFAVALCTELGLGGEFITGIAYSIRAQLNFHKKTCSNYTNLPTIEIAFRTGDLDLWSPVLGTLTEQEMERMLKDQERNARRMRRLAYTHPYLK